MVDLLVDLLVSKFIIIRLHPSDLNEDITVVTGTLELGTRMFTLDKNSQMLVVF